MYIPTLHDKFLALKIEIQCNLFNFFYFFFQGGICNLDHLVTCVISYANTHGIPRNSGDFYCKKYRGISYFFQKIPYSVGSQKRTSVDTLPAHRSDCAFVHRIRIGKCAIKNWEPIVNCRASFSYCLLHFYLYKPWWMLRAFVNCAKTVLIELATAQ